MAPVWPTARSLWPALVLLGLGLTSLSTLALAADHLQGCVCPVQSGDHGHFHDHQHLHSTCPAPSPPHPFCLTEPQPSQGHDPLFSTPADPPSPSSGSLSSTHVSTAINQPASSPSIPGSTIVLSADISSDTQTLGSQPTVTLVMVGKQGSITKASGTHPEAPPNTSTRTSPSATPSPSAESANIAHPAGSMANPIPTPTSTTPSTERHIPSYEQWRKQVLEKKNKPAEPSERKQRKRKPYQEAPVDVAVGEDELGFVFPNLDNGNANKGSEDRFQHLADHLGSAPDLKNGAGAKIEWIKSEYAKDPKDRFNHASATCAASVVKASKDATSITAILNEGKDYYMLSKCSTPEKFFVVELCEEILVDTFILGNYEFFSSTFKDFVVSVNRYPPRDDGWSVLGHFQARNTRDAQVFKPATPQLATYIRFDFVNHYGREYYCPVTLLRVYGATALEQLKQEEEEEKRIALEEKKLAELEKAKRVAEDEDAGDDEDGDDSEVHADDHPKTSMPTQETDLSPEIIDVVDIDAHENHSGAGARAVEGDIRDSELGIVKPTWDEEIVPIDDNVPWHDSEADIMPIGSPIEKGSPTFVLPERANDERTEGDHPKDPPAVWHDLPEVPATSFQESMPSDYVPTVVLPPVPSTSPATIQDDDEWKSADLGMITLSQKLKPTHLPKPPHAQKTFTAGVGTTGGSSSSATESSSHPLPSSGHSSQESVYKNIVNRLKVLELNSSLSYQYLEEQSNVFNEVLDSSSQKINQLVIHLNEANSRLEILGRKYDQLAYSYRSHVEIDGEKRRQEFMNMASQVHVLGSQVMFQRQLFVVLAIILFSAFAFVAVTRSSSMHYALQQSPLAAKLRAISGHGRHHRPDDIAGSVRIGSVESLSHFDQMLLQVQSRLAKEQQTHSVEDTKFTPPISPIAPLTPDPNHTSEEALLDQRRQPPRPSAYNVGGRLFLHSSHSHSPQQFPLDYRPDSPVFQGPSDSQDAGQLSDADVAYMSRDMNMDRKALSGSLPTTPVMKRLSMSHSSHSQYHPSSMRQSSSLRMDSTASLESPVRSEPSSPEATLDPPVTSESPVQEKESLGPQIINAAAEILNQATPVPKAMSPTFENGEEDVGFMSDSALDSVPESMVEGRGKDSLLLKRKKSKDLYRDQVVPWRRPSYETRDGGLEDEEQAREGDDESSPQVSRKTIV